MKSSIIIGIDAGTSQIKCAAFTSDGELLVDRSTGNEYTSLADGTAEQSAPVTRNKVIDTLTLLVADLGAKATNVSAIAVTAQGDGLLLTDSTGHALHDGMLWLDSRAADIAADIQRSDSFPEIFEKTGTAINAAQMRSQMRWLEHHQPALLDNAHSAFHWKDYLYFCLTGIRAADPSESLFTFGDFASGEYAPEVFKALELEHRQHLLPPIIDGLTTSHRLLPELADQAGLPDTTEVTLGFVDVICSALGGGLYNSGQSSAITILGTTGIHMRYANSAKQLHLPGDRTGYTIAFPGGGFVQVQSNMAATMNLDWLLGLACEAMSSMGQSVELSELYDKLDQCLQTTQPSSTLYHPYIATAGERGPFVNVDARASFIGLESNTGFYDLARSVIEGLGYATRDCYEALGELPSEIRLTGGAARSKIVQQILASILNRPVRVVEQKEAAAAGAAMMAAVKHGYYPSIAECCDQWLSDAMGSPTLPVPEHAKHYEHLYSVYLRYRKEQPQTWADLAAARKRQITT